MPLPHEFADWLRLTREATVLSPTEILNAAQTQRTWFIGEMLAAGTERRVMAVAGGTEISERIKLTNMGRFGPYVPGAQAAFGRVSTKQRLRAGWRYYKNDVSWTDADIILNPGANKELVFKDFRRSLTLEGWADHWEGMEATLWEQPNQALMEPSSVNLGKNYSIPAIITENTNGANPYRAPGWGSGSLMDINPTTYANWRNAVRRYNDGSPGDTTSGLFAQFDYITLDLQFNPPRGKGSDAFNDPTWKAQKIVTNLDGRAMYSRLLRAGNDSWRAGPQDPSYGGPTWMGKPIEYASGLDTALLQETNGVYAGTPYTTGKPRFFFPNFMDLFPRYHPERLFHMSDVTQGVLNQIDTYGLVWTTWGNIIALNRRTQGIVAPQSDI